MITPFEPNIGNDYISYEHKPPHGGLEYHSIAYVAAAVDFVYLLGATGVGFTGYQYAVFGSAPDPSLFIGIGLVLSTIFVLAMHLSLIHI